MCLFSLLYEKKYITHCKTCFENSELLPKNSPTICRLRPFLFIKNFPTSAADMPQNFFSTKNSNPLVGFL